MIRTTATIENGNEMIEITIEGPAEEIQEMKQNVKQIWVRTGGTIIWE